MEAHYRLLLNAFPARHRRQYQEEMLGVLMDRARPGQRRPTLVETVDLLRAATSVRLRALRDTADDHGWSTAAAVIGIVAAILLASLGLRNLVVHLGWRLLVDDIMVRSLPDVLHDLVWLPVVLAALVGWRTGAAAIAWLVTLAEAVVLVERYRMFPTDLLYGLRPLLVAVIASVGLAMSVRHRPVAKLLGRWRTAGLLLAGLLVVGSGVAALLQVTIVPLPGGDAYRETDGRIYFRTLHLSVDLPATVLYLIALVLLLIVLAPLAGSVRRRIATVALPVVVLYLVIDRSFLGYRMATYHFSPPLPLSPEQWVLLALPPVGVFALGIVGLYWYEGRRRPDPVR
ncbi:hypothetical protein [Plantactinospora soyae]|uniref:Uncharacterized protein n=1 Tax=Plantactinospora soyae TaxID=1544732 RepID=A0A927MCE5_9ACTN|nr:hypothetical protein [Plantactinospora soyae]MBE1492007.1 hypothetical protein [Plantactinospora soyae]